MQTSIWNKKSSFTHNGIVFNRNNKFRNIHGKQQQTRLMHEKGTQSNHKRPRIIHPNVFNYTG